MVPFELVIARYKEPLDWLLASVSPLFFVTVYSKSREPLGHDVEQRIQKLVHLPNCGREAGTYLHHITSEYDNLAGVTVFLPGTAFDPEKRFKSECVMSRALQTRGSFLGGMRYNDVAQDQGAFTIERYRASRSPGAPTIDLVPAPVRPFGEWYRQKFGSYHSEICCYYAIFAVSRELAHQRSRDEYERLYDNQLKEYDGTELAHYFERAWDAVFRFPKECTHPLPI